MQAQWFSELGVLRTPSLDGSLESWSARCTVQTPFSSGSSWELQVLSRLYNPVLGSGLWQECVPAFATDSDVGIFSIA